jgi:hypothetical protein
LKFIQAIAAFSYLNTEKLGWDPTMSVLKGTAGVPSYQFPWQDLKHFEDAYSIQWVVDSPRQPGRNGKTDQYVSIRSLSIVGAEMMCGRATVVLEVVSLKDFCNKKEGVS